MKNPKQYHSTVTASSVRTGDALFQLCVSVSRPRVPTQYGIAYWTPVYPAAGLRQAFKRAYGSARLKQRKAIEELLHLPRLPFEKRTHYDAWPDFMRLLPASALEPEQA